MRQITRNLKIKHPFFSSFQNLLFAPHQTPRMKCLSIIVTVSSQAPNTYFLRLLFPSISQATARHLAFSLLEKWNIINIMLNFMMKIPCYSEAECFVSSYYAERTSFMPKEQDYTTLFKREMLNIKKK